MSFREDPDHRPGLGRHEYSPLRLIVPATATQGGLPQVFAAQCGGRSLGRCVGNEPARCNMRESDPGLSAVEVAVSSQRHIGREPADRSRLADGESDEELFGARGRQHCLAFGR